MCEEIDRIFNTIRPIDRNDNCTRWYKMIFENELKSINRYVMGRDPFTCDPEYYKVPLISPEGKIIRRNGKPIMQGGQIVRYRGEVPKYVHGELVTNPTYYSQEAVKHFKKYPWKCASAIWDGLKYKHSKHSKK